MKSNFEFLKKYWPALAQIGETAEHYLYSDPNSCMYKLGMFGERLVHEIFAFEKLSEPSYDNTQANRIRILKRERLIPKKIDDILFALRKTRNDAVHKYADSVDDAKTLLSLTYNLAVWFMEVYGEWNFSAPAFVIPEEVIQPDYDSIIKKQEAKIAELTKQVTTVKTAVSNSSVKERAEKAEAASESMELSEAETRIIIDDQLQRVGWEADTNNLRYSKGTRPQKGHNMAIAEWPTDSTTGKAGYADYVLFVGEKMVGIIEAKKAAIDIPSVLSYSYREAVIDGYLVDHDAPHNIQTRLRTEGIQYKKGECLVIYDPVSGQLLNSDELEDDMKFEIDTFNRQVVTEKFNRAVFEEIAWDLDPDGPGKTLIYAVDDDHADLIVKILKEIYSKGGVANEIPFEVSEGWEWCRVRDVASVKGGKRLPKRSSSKANPFRIYSFRIPVAQIRNCVPRLDFTR